MAVNETSLELHIASSERKLAISSLKVDPSYQRTPSQDFIDEIARDYDIIKVELPLVSDRGERPGDEETPGGLWIVSGQHRIRAAHKLGIKTILCRVMDLTNEENPRKIEAYYRLGTNRRVGDQHRDSFKAKVAMEDDDAVAIVAICTRHGVHINFDTAAQADHGINATAALEILYRRDQGAVLSETLDVLKLAYGEINNPRVCSSNMMKAVAWFIEVHSLDANQARLVDKLQTMTVRQLDGRAAQMQSIGGKSRWQNIYLVMLELYNERLTPANMLQPNFKGASRVANIDAEKTKAGQNRGNQ